MFVIFLGGGEEQSCGEQLPLASRGYVPALYIDIVVLFIVLV